MQAVVGEARDRRPAAVERAHLLEEIAGRAVGRGRDPAERVLELDRVELVVVAVGGCRAVRQLLGDQRVPRVLVEVGRRRRRDARREPDDCRARRGLRRRAPLVGVDEMLLASGRGGSQDPAEWGVADGEARVAVRIGNSGEQPEGVRVGPGIAVRVGEAGERAARVAVVDASGRRRDLCHLAGVVLADEHDERGVASLARAVRGRDELPRRVVRGSRSRELARRERGVAGRELRLAVRERGRVRRVGEVLGDQVRVERSSSTPRGRALPRPPSRSTSQAAPSER